MAEKLKRALEDKNRLNIVFDSIVENLMESVDRTRLRCVFHSIIRLRQLQRGEEQQLLLVEQQLLEEQLEGQLLKQQLVESQAFFKINQGLLKDEEHYEESLGVLSDNIPEAANAVVSSVKGIWGSEGTRIVSIINKTGIDIEVKFSKKAFKNTKELVKDGVTASYSINPRNGFFGTKNYWCDVWYKDIHFGFYAYGVRSPRLNNRFEITSVGIKLKANEQIPEDCWITKWPEDSRVNDQVDNPLI